MANPSVSKVVRLKMAAEDVFDVETKVFSRRCAVIDELDSAFCDDGASSSLHGKPKADRGVNLWRFVRNSIQRIVALDDVEGIWAWDRVWLCDGTTGERLLYREAVSVVENVGQTLKNHFGVHEGDIVWIHAHNHFDYPLVLFGLLSIGAVPANLPPGSQDLLKQEVQSIGQSKNGRTTIICSETLLPELEATFSDTEMDLQFLTFGCIRRARSAMLAAESSGLLRRTRHPSHRQTLEERKESSMNSGGDDLAAIYYSSGTTGRPKAVKHTHATLVRASVPVYIEYAQDTEDAFPDGTTVVTLNFSHLGILLHILAALGADGTTVFVSNHDPSRLMEIIARYQPKRVSLFPKDTIYLCKSAESLPGFSLNSVEEMILSGAVMPAMFEHLIWSKFPNLIRFIRVYGSTECTWLAVGRGDQPPGCIGKIMLGLEAKVLDLQTGEALEPGQFGELCYRSSSVTPGYANNLKATRAAFTPDGFFRSGDYGCIDQDCRVFIKDRVNDLISYHCASRTTEMLSPSAMEAALYCHPKVKQAAVVGVPALAFSCNPTCHQHGRQESAGLHAKGEIPVAFVVLDDAEEASSLIDEDELRTFVAGSIPQGLELRVEIAECIPMTPAGKIYRAALKEKFVPRKCHARTVHCCF